MGDGEYTSAVGADGAQVRSHGANPANGNARRQGPGLHSVRTDRVRRIHGDALAAVLDAGPVSRRGLAGRLGVAEKIVRDWCSGERPIDGARLREVAPGVYQAWQLRLAVTGRENAA